MSNDELRTAADTIKAALQAARNIPPASGSIRVNGWSIHHTHADGSIDTHAFGHRGVDGFQYVHTHRDAERNTWNPVLHIMSTRDAVEDRARRTLVDILG